MAYKELDFGVLKPQKDTIVTDYDYKHILKSPVDFMKPSKKDQWLAEQKHAKLTTEALRAIGNPSYKIPLITDIKDTEYAITEERISGGHLTKKLYDTLTSHQKLLFIKNYANLLYDLNKLTSVYAIKDYNISAEINITRLNYLKMDKMPHFFTNDIIAALDNTINNFINFSYDAIIALSHGNINSQNLFFNTKTGIVSATNWRRTKQQSIMADIFCPTIVELQQEKALYNAYYNLYDHSFYQIPSPSEHLLSEIIKNYQIKAYLLLLTKKLKTLKVQPTDNKAELENLNILKSINQCIAGITKVEQR